jgi:hypothetical protein
MKYLNFKSLLIVGSILISYSTGFSQGVTTASISGKVVDDSGETLPGASVVAIHNPTGTQYSSSTRADGRFHLPNLRIGGPYTVTVSFIGYESRKTDGLFLKLGENINLEFSLSQSAMELGEVIISDTELKNKDKTGSSIAFDNNTIRKLPTITRSAADIYRLTPSASGNSFAGRNDQFNNFSLNGSIFSNPFGLDAATPGGQTDAQPISLDAIDQIQVTIAPYDVTQSGFTGASVNAVTKSGTNNFEGTVFTFFRNDKLTGKKVKEEKIFVPKLTQLQSGISIGGPIVKDKAFFFVNFEMERRDDLGSSFVAKRGAQDGLNESRVEAADLDAVATALRSLGYEPGPYEGYIHETNNQKGIVKIDYSINQNHSLSFIYNFLDASKQLPAHPSAIGRRGPDAVTLQFRNSGYQINNIINSGLLELRSTLGEKFSNKFQLGTTYFKDSRDPFSTPFPVLNINRDGVRYIVAGHEPFSIHNRLDQRIFQISDNLEIYAGKHTLSIGTAFEKFSFDNSFNLGVYEPFESAFSPPFGGNNEYYTGGTFGPGFSSVQNFLDFVASGDMTTIYNFSKDAYATNNANNTWALAETNLGQWALYAQDKVAVNDNLMLTIGLRMDIPLYFDTQDKIKENIARKGGLWDPDNGSFGNYNPAIQYFDENGNPIFLNSTVLPKSRPLFSPRVGFNWASGSKNLVIRGGSGLFTGRFPFVWIGNQVANPDFFFYTTTDPDFKFPQVWRTNLGVDKQLGKDWLVTADIIYTKDINAIMVRNYGRSTPSGTLLGADNRNIYADGDKSVNQFGDFTNAYVFTNVNEGYSFNTTLSVQKDWSNGLYTSLGYNYLDAKDISSIEAEISGDAFDRNPALGNINKPQLAPSIYGNKHRLVGSANKTFTYGNGGKFSTTFSLFLEYVKGGRFSYTYSGDINGDGSGLNDLLYVPTDAQIDQMDFRDPVFPGDPTQAEQRSALKAFIAQDDYLSERRGQYAEKYGILSPWYSRWDLRVLQDFKLGNKNTIQFSIDVLNLGNLVSSNWGVRKFPTNTQPIGVSVDNGDPTYSFDTNLKSTFTSDASLLSRWQIQFGLRYIFK